MRDWIVILVLYVLVLFGFAWCGGLRAAGRSIEDWGRRSTAPRGRSATRSADRAAALRFRPWTRTPLRSGCSAA